MNILFLCDDLNMCAESLHMAESAVLLKEKGYNITVGADRGFLNQTLSSGDIVCKELPFFSNKDAAQIKLIKLIKDKHIDLVHCFSIQTMQVMSFVSKLVKCKYITTLFKIPGELPRGAFPKQIIVTSEKLKDGLSEKYGLARQDIHIVCEGIYEPAPSESQCESVSAAIGFSRDSYKILYFSDLDENNTKVGHALEELAVSLKAYCPEAEILIFGRSSDYDSLKSKAATQNARVGKNFIFLHSNGISLPYLVGTCDMVVGSKRSAMYAVKYKKDLILADGNGYEGLLDELSMDKFFANDFATDSKLAVSKNRLLTDMKACIYMDRDRKKEIKEKALKLSEEKYSKEKLTDLYMKIYNDAESNRDETYDVLLSGYYGFKNSGDDALLSAIIKEIRDIKPDARFAVLSKTPAETRKIYGIDAYNRFNIFEVKKAIKKSKLLISGGGSLIQDVTSSKSLFYYLFLIKLALKYGKRTMLYANGIGPVQKKKNRERAKNILNMVNCITLRDEKSVETLKDMGVMLTPVFVTADPSVSIEPMGLDRVREIFSEEQIPEKPYFAISIREWKNKNIAAEVARAADYISVKHDLVPVFIPMQNPNDISISVDCIKLMKTKGYLLKGDYSFFDVMTITSKATLVIGMRLHLLMYGANSAVPVIGLVYDPKITAYLDYLKQDFTIDARNVTHEKICAMADNIFSRYDEISGNLNEKVKQLKKLTKKNAETAVKLINGEKI